MVKQEIKCEHDLPVSQCEVCYPIFLAETTVGEVVDQDRLQEAIDRGKEYARANGSALTVDYLIDALEDVFRLGEGSLQR